MNKCAYATWTAIEDTPPTSGLNTLRNSGILRTLHGTAVVRKVKRTNWLEFIISHAHGQIKIMQPPGNEMFHGLLPTLAKDDALVKPYLPSRLDHSKDVLLSDRDIRKVWMIVKDTWMLLFLATRRSCISSLMRVPLRKTKETKPKTDRGIASSQAINKP